MDSSGHNRIEFLGNSCGQHGAYTFYRGIRYWKDGTGKCHSLSLGEFFHGQMNSGDQVIPLMGELQLLWEEKHHEGLKLSSVRLYILPENCPGGRLPSHGQDEVLAEDDKIVLKVEDLLRLVVFEPVVFSRGLLASHKIFPRVDLSRPNGVTAKILTLFRLGSAERNEDEVADSKGTRVVILSYARYCRYRAALKRFEGSTNRWLADFLIAAIGGFSTNGTETRVMFCRGTVEHPVVESYEYRMNHLAPSLKGRRRKKRPKSKTNESEDSNESETNSEKNALRCALTAEGVLGKRRPTEKLSELSKPKPKAKKNLFLTEKGFLKRLHQYMTDRGTPIVRIPILGFKEVNLFQFYQCTQQLGGYDAVTERRLWKLVYDQLGGSPGNTSAATGTRKNYEKLLLEFERHVQSRKKPCSVSAEIKPVTVDNNSPVSASLSIPCRLTNMEIADDSNDPSSPKIQESEHLGGSLSNEIVRLEAEKPFSKRSDKPQMRSTMQVLNRQKKLLRKTSVLACSKVKRNTGSDPVEEPFLSNRKDIGCSSSLANFEQFSTAAVCSDFKLKPSTVDGSCVSRRHDDDSPEANSRVTAIIPCTVSLEIISEKLCEKPEMHVKGNLAVTDLPVKQEKPEPLASELAHRCGVADLENRIDEFRCSIGGKTTSPSLELKIGDRQGNASSVGFVSRSQKLHRSCSSEAVGLEMDRCKSATNASSISLKLLSGGHAVVEMATSVNDHSSRFMSNSSPNIPIDRISDELSQSRGFKDLMASPLSVNANSLTSTPPLAPIRNFLNSNDSFSDVSLSGLTVARETNHSATLGSAFPFDISHSSDDEPRFVASRCRSAGGAMHSLPTHLSSSLKNQLVQSAPKRIHPARDPLFESYTIGAKKYKSDAENHASSCCSPIERDPQPHRSGVISSPIKRFIDQTKCWIPPLDPDRMAADAQDLSWIPSDNEPTDLSMKTLMCQSRSATELSQDEPLDLSKSSSMHRAERYESNLKPVVLPGCNATIPSSTVLRNGHALPTAANKVAFVAPSLRSSSNLLPATSYHMSNFHSSVTLTSSLPQNLQTMTSEHMAPLLAYSPSFHPAFQLLSTPILSAIAAPGSLLGSGSAASSPRLAFPFFPVIPVAQGASSSLSADPAPEIGNPFAAPVFKRSNRK